MSTQEPTGAPRRRRGPTTISGILIGTLGVLVIFLAIALVVELVRDDEVPAEGVPAVEHVLEPGHVLGVGEVNDRGDELVGQEITLGGFLDGDPVHPNVMSMGGMLYEATDILVITNRPGPGVFPGGMQARVTGMLTYFDQQEIEAHMGTELENDVLGDRDGDLTLLADSILFFAFGPNIGMQVEGLAAGEEMEQWRVTLAGEVVEVYSATVYRLEGDVVIIDAAGAGAPAEGDVVRVTGNATLVGEETVPEGMLDELDDEDRDAVLGYPAVIAEEAEVGTPE